MQRRWPLNCDVPRKREHYPTPQELDPAQRDRGGGRVLDQLSRADTGPGVTDTAQRDRRPPRGERTRRVGPDILRPTSPASDPDIRPEEHTSEIQPPIRNSYAVYCLTH